jgi:hypothetical protein
MSRLATPFALAAVAALAGTSAGLPALASGIASTMPRPCPVQPVVYPGGGGVYVNVPNPSPSGPCYYTIFVPANQPNPI